MLYEIWNIQINAFRKFCELERFVCARQNGFALVPVKIQPWRLGWGLI